MKSGPVILHQILCCGRQKQQGLKKGPQRGSLHPALGALPCLQRWPLGSGSFSLQDKHGPELQVGPVVPGGLRSHSHPSCRAQPRRLPEGLLLPPETWPSESVCVCFHPSPAGSQCEKPPQLSSEIGPRARGEGDQMSRFHQQHRPWEGNRQAPERPALPMPLCRWTTWKSRPSAVAWELPTSQICCRQQQTKPLANRAAGDKRERAPQEQWQPLRELATEGRTKACAAPNSSCCLSTKQGGANLSSFI